MAVGYLALVVIFSSGYLTCWLWTQGLGWLVFLLGLSAIIGLIILSWWDNKTL